MIKDIDISKRLIRTQHSAKTRGIPFDMSFKKMKALLCSKTCFFTGNKLNKQEPTHEYYLTLDRLDADRGYVDNNVVACGRLFNLRKKDLTVEDITLIYKAFKKKKLI